MSTTYEEWMAKGHRRMEAGRIRAAIKAFGEAHVRSGDREQSSAALHMQGVCMRVIGNLSNASALLNLAAAQTSSPQRRLHILRDHAMVEIDMGKSRLAYELAMASSGGLYGVIWNTPERSSSKRQDASDEAFMSLAIAGDAQYRTGGRYNKDVGYRKLWTAYRNLRREHYKLNVALRILKYGPLDRYLNPRVPLQAVRIALKEHNLQRVGEIAMLMVFGLRGYNAIMRLYRQLQRRL